jgi:CO/xanthine dehydrogenase FAD-binding subunit
VWLVLREGTVEKARIGLGAVAPTPMRAKKAEDFLVGRTLTETTARECADIVSGEVAPISDLRASESYRREMASVLTRRLLMGCGEQ